MDDGVFKREGDIVTIDLSKLDWQPGRLVIEKVKRRNQWDAGRYFGLIDSEEVKRLFELDYGENKT